MQHEQQPPGQPAGGDYEYDLAHEGEAAARSAQGRPEHHAPVYVPTETSDTTEDLSYDLAHDVPRRPGE